MKNTREMRTKAIPKRFFNREEAAAFEGKKVNLLRACVLEDNPFSLQTLQASHPPSL